MDIKCNVDEVIRYSRAKMYNEGKRSLAPTMPNPLRNEILPSQDLDQLSGIIDGEFELSNAKRKPAAVWGAVLSNASIWLRSMLTS